MLAHLFLVSQVASFFKLLHYLFVRLPLPVHATYPTHVLSLDLITALRSADPSRETSRVAVSA
jgi:hypothetical protein